MRNIPGFGKWRDRDEWNAEPELIKAGACVRERPCRICGESSAKRLLNVEAERAFRAATGLLAGGRIGKIGTQAGNDSVGRPCMSLPGPWRSHVIVRAAMLVVSDKDDRVLPERAIAHRIHDS